MGVFAFIDIACRHDWSIMVNQQEQEEIDFSYKLHTQCLGQKRQWLARCDSTQAIALEQAHYPYTHGTLIYTQEQTHGKGRHGKYFYSAQESCYLQSLTCSLIFKTFSCTDQAQQDKKLSPMQAITLGFLVALAIRESIAIQTKLNTQIKWPNDILIEHKKVCGILTSYQNQNNCGTAVIGFGINISATPQEPYIPHAGALYPIQTPSSIIYTHRLDLLANVLKQIEQHIDNYHVHGHHWLIQCYEQHMAYMQEYRAIHIAENQTYQVKILGLDDSLALRVYNEKQGEHLITTGDIGFL